MAAYGSSFETVRSIEERKESKRRAREQLLSQAKEEYEKEEKRKEQRRLRGEDTWMLNDVSQRLEQIQQEHSGKKKKGKKSKKEKKKKSKKIKSENSGTSDCSTDSDGEWVVAAPAQPAGEKKAWKVQVEPPARETGPAAERDEWMTLDFMSLKATSTAALRAEKQKEKAVEREKAEAVEKEKLQARELNPFWRDGGSGLPPEEGDVTSVKKVQLVEDGGLSWLKKSLQRMKEQSEKEKRSLEDIVAQRYGSMEIFQNKMESAEKAVSQSTRREHDKRKDGWRRSTYHNNDSRRFVKPDDYETNRDNYRDNRRHDRSSHIRVGEYSLDKQNAEKSDSKGKGTEPERKGYLAKRFEETADHRSSSSKLKHQFLKPSEAEDEVSLSTGLKPQRPRSSLSHEDLPKNEFSKPTSDDPQPSWRRTSSKSQQETKQQSNTEECKVIKTSAESNDKDSGVKGHPSSEVRTPSPRPDSGSPPVRLLSEEEMNRLGAKIVKAEIMGNTGSSTREEQEVLLVRTDQSGRAWPLKSMADPVEPRGGRRKRQMAETHIDKERVRYFHDDDNQSLQDLVKREKMGTAEDQNKLYMRMMSKLTEKTDQDYYTLDDMFVSKAANKERGNEEEERERQQAISEHRRLAARMEKCPYCFDNAELPKHLIIAIGVKVYLCLPNHLSLTEGHCLIVPLQHYTAATLLDEDIWNEIQTFRRSLVKMFEEKGLDCVFLETNMSIKKRYHLVYECIPLPKEIGDMAPIYFKKAILESDEEWSMNKKLIDLSSKDVRRSVPKGLPYFSVDFGLQGGFAHVIEDQNKFPHYFGKEIIGGMLDLEPRVWRKAVRENFDDQRKKVLQFAQWWKPFDVTKNKD
ncbi:CWF19-like protein 2 isoform X2 [Pseudophryne corroboree]|uniref:CWF19-like protein 2 isoform X2 n=1 Tax=Pseudophryne corroboree TaxID=495146 RepID=UPI003081D30D